MDIFKRQKLANISDCFSTDENFLKYLCGLKAVLGCGLLQFGQIRLQTCFDFSRHFNFCKPEGIEKAIVMRVGITPSRIMQGITQFQQQKIVSKCILFYIPDYSKLNVGEGVMRFILNYTDYMNRIIWGKNQ